MISVWLQWQQSRDSTSSLWELEMSFITQVSLCYTAVVLCVLVDVFVAQFVLHVALTSAVVTMASPVCQSGQLVENLQIFTQNKNSSRFWVHCLDVCSNGTHELNIASSNSMTHCVVSLGSKRKATDAILPRGLTSSSHCDCDNVILIWMCSTYFNLTC